MRCVFTLSVLPLALAACKQEAPRRDAAPTGSANASVSAAASPATKAVAAVTVSVDEESELFKFAYDYPAVATAIPALKAALDKDRAKQRAELAAVARRDRSERKQAGFDFYPYEYTITWSVVADLPRWLSLLGESYAYTGGAHGNGGSEALLWDKAIGQRRTALDLFQSKIAFSAAVRAPFCAELNRQRAKKRGFLVREGSDDPFDECIDPAELTVLLGSADKAHFTRIGIIANAYSAGPYVEGAYEVTLPVTPAVLRAVKPQYRADFVSGR